MKVKARVCKKMFLQALLIGEWVRNSNEQRLDDKEVMDEDHDPINTRKSETDKTKNILVRSFFESSKSHDRRKDSSKLYLEPKW